MAQGFLPTAQNSRQPSQAWDRPVNSEAGRRALAQALELSVAGIYRACHGLSRGKFLDVFRHGFPSILKPTSRKICNKKKVKSVKPTVSWPSRLHLDTEIGTVGLSIGPGGEEDSKA